MKHYTATEARNNFGELMEEAYKTGAPIIVERRNKPLVAVVPLAPTDLDWRSPGEILPVFCLGTIKGSLSRDELYDEEDR